MLIEISKRMHKVKMQKVSAYICNGLKNYEKNMWQESTDGTKWFQYGHISIMQYEIKGLWWPDVTSPNSHKTMLSWGIIYNL